MITAIVLAAGLSKRMGKANKMLLPYKGKPVIAVTVDNIVAAGVSDIVVVTGFEQEKIQEVLNPRPVRIMSNPDYEKGMTTSIQKGIAHAKGNGYMICLGDMIHIMPGEYTLLTHRFNQAYTANSACIVVPFYKAGKGNPVIFSRHYHNDIMSNTDMEGCKNIVQANKQNIVAVEMENAHILSDLDYPEDYAKLNNE